MGSSTGRAENSEAPRRLAARRLLTCLNWYEEQGLHYHLVAHSHGGSVLWEALQLGAEALSAGGRLARV